MSFKKGKNKNPTAERLLWHTRLECVGVTRAWRGGTRVRTAVEGFRGGKQRERKTQHKAPLIQINKFPPQWHIQLNHGLNYSLTMEDLGILLPWEDMYINICARFLCELAKSILLQCRWFLGLTVYLWNGKSSPAWWTQQHQRPLHRTVTCSWDPTGRSSPHPSAVPPDPSFLLSFLPSYWHLFSRSHLQDASSSG